MRPFLVVSVACLASLNMAACRQQRPPAPPQPKYQVRVSALYDRLSLSQPARAFARACHPPDLTLSILDAPNGPENLKNIEEGRADIAFVGASLLFEGYEGVIPEFPERFEKISGLAVVQPLVQHVLVGPRSTISSLKDLAGRTVASGRPGARNAITSPKLLAAAHLTPPAREVQTDFDTAIARLFQGTVDAIILPAPAPFPLVKEAITGGARLVEIKGSLADDLRESVRSVRPYTIPPDTYPGLHARIVTLAIDTVLVGRRSLSNELAQRIVGALFDCLPQLTAAEPSFQSFEIARAAATPVPLHPGAALFYRERELEP